MNQYAYRIYKGTFNNPAIGGTVSAKNLDDAQSKIILRNKVQVIHEIKNTYPDDYFMLNGNTVTIIIYLNPQTL